MKTSEFIKRVEELGYVTDKDNWYVYVRNKRFTVAMVSETRVNAIEANLRHADIPNKLFDLIVEYAKTPLDEREEEKKFRVKCRITNDVLYVDEKLEWKNEYDRFTHFTLKELEDLGIDIEHYDLEEVE